MKPFHILTYLFGDQDSKYALVEINASVICAITAARRNIAAFSATHGGHTALDHHGCLTVHLLSDIPESLMETHGDCIAESLVVADLDIAALLAEAAEAGLTREATDTGIVIGPHSICLVAHEDGWELELGSADFLNLIEPYLTAIVPTDSGITTNNINPRQLATILAALRNLQNDLRNGHVEPGDFDHFETDLEILTDYGIEELCQQLNFGESAPRPQ